MRMPVLYSIFPRPIDAKPDTLSEASDPNPKTYLLSQKSSAKNPTSLSSVAGDFEQGFYPAPEAGNCFLEGFGV